MSSTTKKQFAATTTALLGVFALQPTAAAEQKFQKLTGAQIQAKFPGMELTDEAHWGEVFERNGTLTITSMGHKSAGKWRIQKDELCLETGKEPGGGCYEVWLSGGNVELRNQASSTPLEAVLQKPPPGRRSAEDCFDEYKEEFNEAAVAGHRACMSCRCNAGSERSRRREIRKTYGWADPRQAQRHGTDGQRALARSLSTQWNCDEYFNGAQANRQMA